MARRHQHSRSSSSSSSWSRNIMVLLTVCFAAFYIGFFVASSRHALTQTQHHDLHHVKKGLTSFIQSSLDSTNQRQEQNEQPPEEGIGHKNRMEEMEHPRPEEQQQQQQQEVQKKEEENPEDKKQQDVDKAEHQDESERTDGQESNKEMSDAAAPVRGFVKKNFPENVPAKDGTLECPRNVVFKRKEKGSIVYWRKWIERTPTWGSCVKAEAQKHRKTKYITFEPDEGGFNNIRMALEIFVVFALVTGRTLVLPDEYNIYLLGKRGTLHDFDDFFDMELISEYVQVIKMKEFLQIEGLTGQLKNGELPPNNATVFDRKRPLWEYIRRATDPFPVSPNSHVVGFCLPPHVQSRQDLQDNKDFLDFAGNRQLQVYGPELQAQRVIHFTSMMDGGHRFLNHFYGFFYFGDKQADNFVKRFVRDKMHYRSDIFCYAARIVELLHGDSGGSKEYDAIHIRRGDFQFKDTRLDVVTIFENVKDIIPPGSLVYVLTDEHNTTFFDPVRGKYRLRFLKDYLTLANLEEDMHPNLSGMVEQIVGSGARNYVGTYFSTLTGYITRLRGYHGRDPGYYYLDQFKYELHDDSKHYPSEPYFHREWESAYEGIDVE